MTKDAAQRFPLAWPKGKPRRPWNERIVGHFRTVESKGSAKSRKITLAEAAQRVEEEVERLDARWPILSTNAELRLDGRPRSDRTVSDPGAALYFDLKGKPHVMACDTFTTLEQNIGAIAAHLKAVRAIERYGVATAAEALQAFTALPPPAEAKPKRPWWEVLGVARDGVDADDVRAMFRVKANKAHPDKPGGSHDAMAELTTALAEALAEIKS